MEATKRENSLNTFHWFGREKMCLDRPVVNQCGRVVIGCYGGNTVAGATKNEDAALVWETNDWRFAALCDAHLTGESAEVLLAMLEGEQERIVDTLTRSSSDGFSDLHHLLLSRFCAEEFREKCRRVQGETACLIAVQKANYVWWLSIGDCLIYVLHPELAELGQYALNQRGFYEWVGRVNTFESAIPCYASGIRELRGGVNQIVLITDGLLECGDRRFERPEYLYELFTEGDNNPAVKIERALWEVHQQKGRDSATIICWEYNNDRACVYPSG